MNRPKMLTISDGKLGPTSSSLPTTPSLLTPGSPGEGMSRVSSWAKLQELGTKTVGSVPIRKISTAVGHVHEQGAKILSESEKYQISHYEMEKFSSITTFHGLVRLYSSQRIIMKFFWLCVILAASGLFIGQVCVLVSNFVARPTLSEVSFDIQGDGILFPSVTICNYNPIKLTFIESQNITGDLTNDVLEYILLAFLQVENLYDMYSNETLNQLHQAYTNYTQKLNTAGVKFDLAKFFVDGGYDCEDMFMQCSFGGIKFNCCEIAVPILTDLGKCYQFTHYNNEKQFRNKQYISGSFYGLEVIANIKVVEYPEEYMSNFFESGLRFFVHSLGVLPMVSAGGTAVSPGRRIYAGIVPKHFTLLPQNQWGNCKPSWDEAEEAQSQLTSLYTASNCEIHCVAKAFIDQCQCVPLRYQLNRTDVEACTPYDLYKCIEVEHWNVENEEYWYKMCPNCLIECDRWDYAIETSYVNIPNRGSIPFLSKKFNMTEGDLVANLVIMNVFMKELAHIEIEQRQGTTFTETMSDIGGNMGLFVGASLITVAELSVFLGRLLWGHFSQKRRKVVVRKVTGSAMTQTNTSENKKGTSEAPTSHTNLEEARHKAVEWWEKYNAEQKDKEEKCPNPRPPPPLVTFSLHDDVSLSDADSMVGRSTDETYDSPSPPRRKNTGFVPMVNPQIRIDIPEAEPQWEDTIGI